MEYSHSNTKKAENLNPFKHKLNIIYKGSNVPSFFTTLFQTNITAIYPKELILLQSNSSDNKATFLDLDIQIHNLHCTIKIYDKRDVFMLILSTFLALMATFQ